MDCNVAGLRYLSVCSGIEAASVAWEPLKFRPIGFSEIETFPCAVLKHRFPNVPNFGDMARFEEWDINETVDILVGGTPCQDLSQGGKGKGWFAERSGLAWTYLSIIKRYQPRWCVWENVTGAIRGKHVEGFCEFAKAIEACGYVVSWRVLDARYFGLPQRRQRVFLVGSLGTGASRKVLLESEGIIGIDSSPSPPPVAVCLTARGTGSLDDRETYIRDDRGVRRLTPIENERLMGFPDNWTLVPYRNGMAKDTPRCRALGNSFAVPVVRWIGQRIAMVQNSFVSNSAQ